MPTSSTAAADPGSPAKGIAYRLEDLHCDVRHLAHVIDTALDAAAEKRPDRMDALMWVARDLAERLDEKIEANYHGLRDGTEARS